MTVKDLKNTQELHIFLDGVQASEQLDKVAYKGRINESFDQLN